jgi:NAD(P)-dependent dehydrogenase (short-subunit alcohol dehydrogenase family)
MQRLNGKVAIITGAGQGIGLAMGKRFAREGAQVVVAEINPATVHAAAEAISAEGTPALAYPIDVREVDAVRAMMREVAARLGSVDILVNNAGETDRAPFLDLTPEQWDLIQSVNQRAVFFCMQAAAQQMIAQMPPEIRSSDRAPRSFGKIINLSSIAGRRGRADAMHYSVSKAAVITMTQGAAMALAPYNINVNAICPSVVPTAMWQKLDRQMGVPLGLPPGEFYRRRVEKVPLKREGTADEVAAMAAFLCSEEADYITGQTYNVDGGSELN